MALKAHLVEARNRLFISLIALVLGTVGGFFLYDDVLRLIMAPVIENGGEVNYASVMAPFDIMLKTSLLLGLVFSAPIWIYQLWAFIVPGLKKKERNTALAFASAAVPLFLFGVGMAYWVLPHALKFFISLTPENAQSWLTTDTYLPFVFRLLIAFGLAMLAPVLMVGLNMVGILKAKMILKHWRITVFLIALVAAMAAPGGDAITMFALGGPLFVTFATATLICFFNDRKRDKKRAKLEAETAASAGEGSHLPETPDLP
ncbi:MAG: twin-arginine translocase subunit TatC [Paeniglutamicibacter terrestris]|uniref:Sec-independent protein translocase protein TatC n=1 Tax=Paeniglutamicibacter terrestris TaxID=2723403 RepID=A0ABX1G8M4_9MICC|nr:MULTISPECIES: twin-arginine translocase subunit TatC [Paeniglutamicibacter]ASN39444.1 twin-arginine translocase subunit TatC [Arthrobacter sp. 7749]NKG21890.1 twin-arginine translocase subunit TatC [Paeniglutamicibacter terrestris]QXQ08777.1 twin-arginine translocase subunit TatC [Paeniglutamicibacter sp. Y32M11]